MAQIIIPERKSSPIGKVLQVGGAIAGGVFSNKGVKATLSGIGAGTGLGETMGSLLGSNKQSSTGIPTPSGVDRRMAQLQQDPMIQLQMAQAALPKLPPQVQESLRPTFSQAMSVASRNSGRGGYA